MSLALTPGLSVRTVSFHSDWRGGEEVHRFAVPRIEERFQSPLLNEENLAVSGDSGLRRIAERVAARLKPIGFVGGYDQGAVEATAALVKQSGGHANLTTYKDGYLSLAVCVDGVVGEVFDLDALQADYRGWLEGTPEWALDDVARELERIAPLRFADFDEFGKVEVDWERDAFRATPGSRMRCGLLLGYPAWSSAAMIRAGFGLPGGYDPY